MICPNCNNEVAPNVAFCPHCGTSMNVLYHKKTSSNTLLSIICGILGLLLFAVIGLGAWFYISQNEKEKQALEQRAREAEEAKKAAEEKKPDTVIVEKVKKVKDHSTTYIEPVNPSIVYIKGNRVNVRDCASMSGEVLGLVKKGETLGYMATYGDWYEVNYYGMVGYIRKYHTNGKRIAIAQ